MSGVIIIIHADYSTRLLTDAPFEVELVVKFARACVRSSIVNKLPDYSLSIFRDGVFVVFVVLSISDLVTN